MRYNIRMNMDGATLLLWMLIASHLAVVIVAKNPIVPDVGMADPHIHIFNNKAYLYATHDYSIANKGFRMDNWWIWSSPDLVKWTEETILPPQNTSLKENFTECWATDAGVKNGQYYFYLSLGPDTIGVVQSPTPTGPWHDPLGHPLIPQGSVKTQSRDPGILQDDDGNSYLVFGTFDYFIAKLNDDMITLAEIPRPVVVSPEDGPFGPGKLDDKPFLHKFNGSYYLSWGCFYAKGSSPYGPFHYLGSVIDESHLGPGYTNQTGGDVVDRHGSFFDFKGQWYFACNDRTHGSTPFFRNTVISYVHYYNNGSIAPVEINDAGVGEYDACAGKIQAENYFEITHGQKIENDEGGFSVLLTNGTSVCYPNIRMCSNFEAAYQMTLHTTGFIEGMQVFVQQNFVSGPTLGICQHQTGQKKEITCGLGRLNGRVNLCLTASNLQGSALLDSFTISEGN